MRPETGCPPRAPRQFDSCSSRLSTEALRSEGAMFSPPETSGKAGKIPPAFSGRTMARHPQDAPVEVRRKPVPNPHAF